MQKVVLVGADQAHVAGVFGTFNFGWPVDVDDEQARTLLSSRNMYVRASDLDSDRVMLEVVDKSRSFRCGCLYADCATPLKVSATLVPYLLRKRNENGDPILRVVE